MVFFVFAEPEENSVFDNWHGLEYNPNMLLGMHISGAGKIYQTLDLAHELGCNTMQIFSRSPQRWRDADLDPRDIEEFRSRNAKLKISPVFIHVPYLINLASPDPKLYKASIKAYIEDIGEAGAMQADYIVTHMGSHKDTSEEAGIERLIKALNSIIEQTKGSSVGILLENTSGSGSWLGYKFSHHREIIAGLKHKERVGLCIDTAHAYLAGYDIASKNGLEAMLEEIDREVGLRLIKLIHLNDACGRLGSLHDRHDHIGKGSIGLAGMRRIINHPKLRDLPFILETPKKKEGDETRNLKAVRKLRK
ncbi:MAG: deoxyribonuclease IV [Candidatus Omnitrophica bacterium]|nr:deoxyribonuclease IV [Candidatus Omnitrophota bacterium]MBU1870098.1 deoxyribonuclease IV [Candidatus Omnitrophota bacterium]